MTNAEVGSRADEVKRGPGRPPTIRKEAEERSEPRFVEVELQRKYVPLLCYEPDDEKTVPPVIEADKLVRPGKLHLKLVRHPDTGAVIEQNKIVVGEGRDKFGRPIDLYKEINDAFPAGTIIPLPEDEAKRLMRAEPPIARIAASTHFG